MLNKKGEKHRNNQTNKKQEMEKRSKKERTQERRCFFFQNNNLTCKFIMSNATINVGKCELNKKRIKKVKVQEKRNPGSMRRKRMKEEERKVN